MDSLESLQSKMNEKNYDAFIIPTSDFHGSEYISDYFKTRQFLSGFTGSAGTLLVTKEKGYLWTDGRYFIQAEKELSGKNIELMKMGEDTPMIEFLEDMSKDKKIEIAIDGRTLSTALVLELKNKVNNANIVLDTKTIDEIWTNRPKMPFSVLYQLSDYLTGKSYQEKLKDIRTEMEKEDCGVYIITALEDQAWLYNLRGNDVLHTPVFLAYTVITLEHNYLYVDSAKIEPTVDKYLQKNEILVRDYDSIYEALKSFKSKKILINLNKANYQIYSAIETNNTIINHEDITLLMKAIKNPTEITNTKNAHIKDAVAVTKLMYYLKNNFGKSDMSEISVTEYLENLRKEQKGFIDLSFNTICAFNEHAAMMHYSATDESNVQINEPGLLLIDSGGHYLEGTTDITRTFALGEISSQMKLHFTTVLKSVIALSQAVFLEGCNGMNLDILARGPIWKLLIDYKCGTGHGVGHILSVHEAPNGFRYKIVPERNDYHPFVPGMITSNEPGIYLENKYGIRIENEMLCVRKGESEFGKFLGFETITLVPIDLDAIDTSLLDDNEKIWLNNYHKEVYKTLEPLLDKKEALWLKNYTRSI